MRTIPHETLVFVVIVINLELIDHDKHAEQPRPWLETTTNPIGAGNCYEPLSS